MKRPRDFQRSKVYKAEKVLNKFVSDKIVTTEDCVAYINEKLLGVLEHYGIKKVVVLILISRLSLSQNSLETSGT